MSTQLLSSADVADRLRVNIRTAQRIIRSIPHINIGTGKKNEHLRVTEEQLQQALALGKKEIKDVILFPSPIA